MRGTEKLTIRWEPGYKGDNDRRYYVEDKVLTIRDVLRINQFIALNEKEIHRGTIQRTGKFFFKMAIDDAIDGIDIDDICAKYLIPEK